MRISESSPIIRFRVVLASLALAVAGFGAQIASADIFSEARAAKKGMLVYAYGSDWSRSGRCVLAAFRDPVFVQAVTNRYVFGVTDDADTMTPAIRCANNWAARGDLESIRLPALFASDAAGRGFLVLENLPITTTPADLVRRLRTAEARHRRATGLLAAADRCADPVAAAEQRGAAMALFAEGVGDARVTGEKCLGAVFRRIQRDDPEDRTGWQRRFTLGNCTKLIQDLNALREAGKTDEARAFLAREKSRSTAHLTLNQRQGVMLLDYALNRLDPAKKSANVNLLDRVAAMDSMTFWGRAAVGFLIREGAPERNRYLKAKPPAAVLAKRRTVPAAAAMNAWAARLRDDLAVLAKVSDHALTDALAPETRTVLVRAYILSGAGTNALARICAHEGGNAFLVRFFADREWMEEFAASGSWHFGGGAALWNLETFIWNVPEAEKSPLLRRAATAFSMNFDATEPNAANTVKTLRIFRDLARAGRLHDRVNDLDVYEWRYLLFPWDRTKPEDLLALNAFANCSFTRLFRQGWQVPYRLRNCFGESVFKPDYYQPWAHTDTRYTVATEIGGVCNMISSFAVTLGHAHGLMAVTAGQPAHCAFLVRPRRGGPKLWEKHYDIKPYTRGKWSIFTRWGGYHNILLGEELYEGSSRAAREFPRWMAAVRRTAARPAIGREVCRDDVTGLYRRAMENVPGHLAAAMDWARYLEETAPNSVERWEALGEAVMKTMPNRIPASIELLGKMFAAQAAAGRPERRRVWADRFLETVREEEGRYSEPPDFGYVIDVFVRTFRASPDELFALHLKALETQKGNRDYFAQILQLGMKRYLGRTKYETRFLSTVTAAMGGSDVRDITPWRVLISQMEARNNPGAVARLVETAAKFFPPPPVREGAAAYPKEDFGGKLVSDRSLVRLSKPHRRDRSERHGELLDASPRRMAKAGVPAVARVSGGDLWIAQRLGGETDIRGVRVVGPKLPALTLESSADGETWRKLGAMTVTGDEARLDLSSAPVRARFIAVKPVNPNSKAVFALEKFLVYGQRRY